MEVEYSTNGHLKTFKETDAHDNVSSSPTVGLLLRGVEALLVQKLRVLC